MVAVQFFGEGEQVGQDRNWPAAPRIGETIVLSGVRKATKVVDVVWHELQNEVRAHVHLEPNVLKNVD